VITAATVTNGQARALADEAVEAGDYMMAFVCDRARAYQLDTRATKFLSLEEIERLRSMTPKQARQMVAAAINYARARAEVSR